MVGRLSGLSTPVGSDANEHGFNVTDRSGPGGLFPVCGISKIKHGKFAAVYKLASVRSRIGQISLQNQPKLVRLIPSRRDRQRILVEVSNSFHDEETLSPTQVL